MAVLYLLRHGVAGPGGNPSLTAEGVRLMEAEARGMKRLGLAPGLILSSPLIRAEQTAALVAAGTAPGVSLRLDEALGPGCSLAAVGRLARQASGGGGVLLVGHQPDMGRLAGALAGMDRDPVFGRGWLCALEIGGWDLEAERGRGALLWHLPAEVLVALGS